VQQLNPEREVLQFSEYAAVNNYRIEYASFNPVPTQKEEEMFV
jgi:hypothetical protein